MHLIKHLHKTQGCSAPLCALLISIFMGGIGQVLAAPPKPFVDSLTFPISNGIQVLTPFTDSRDMLWLSTSGGYLYRYDGGSSSQIQAQFINARIDAWDRLWSDALAGDTWRFGYTDLKTGLRTDVVALDESNTPLDWKSLECVDICI